MNFDQKIKEMWNNNKIAFFLLLIPIAIWTMREQIMRILAGSILKDYNKGLEKDQPLANEVRNTLDEANKHAASAAQHEDNANKPSSDADWHKKGDNNG